jgi:hypothetical protein
MDKAKTGELSEEIIRQKKARTSDEWDRLARRGRPEGLPLRRHVGGCHTARQTDLSGNRVPTMSIARGSDSKHGV